MPAKAQETVRPARTNREGRGEHLQPENIGRMTLYTFKDVLDYAYTQGLVRFGEPGVQVVQTLDANGKPQSTAIVSVAAIFLEDGKEVECWGIGDANFENTGNKNIGQHFIRMAETRAKGRALAHALNLDANFAEEMGDTSDSKPTQNNSTPTRQSSTTNKYPKENPNKFPLHNHVEMGQSEPGWYCEETGEKLKDTPQSSAGRKAQWAVEKTGRILTYDEQQKVLNG